jgi:hypothetical protein
MTLISTVPPITYGYYVGFYSDMHAAVLNDEFEGGWMIWGSEPSPADR